MSASRVYYQDSTDCGGKKIEEIKRELEELPAWHPNRAKLIGYYMYSLNLASAVDSDNLEHFNQAWVLLPKKYREIDEFLLARAFYAKAVYGRMLEILSDHACDEEGGLNNSNALGRLSLFPAFYQQGSQSSYQAAIASRIGNIETNIWGLHKSVEDNDINWLNIALALLPKAVRLREIDALIREAVARNSNDVLVRLQDIKAGNHHIKEMLLNLELAVTEDYVDIFAKIIQAFPLINPYEYLFKAARADSVAVARFLIKHYGLQPNCQDGSDHDNTALHVAVDAGSLDMIGFLLANGANPNIKNKDGEIPLFWAIESQHMDVVKLLVPYTDLGITDAQGLNAIDYADGDLSMAMYLATIIAKRNSADPRATVYEFAKALLQSGEDSLNIMDEVIGDESFLLSVKDSESYKATFASGDARYIATLFNYHIIVKVTIGLPNGQIFRQVTKVISEGDEVVLLAADNSVIHRFNAKTYAPNTEQAAEPSATDVITDTLDGLRLDAMGDQAQSNPDLG